MGMSASTASASLPRPSHDNACARTKSGFRSGSGAHGRFRESIGEGQIRQPDSAVGGLDEQVGIGREVGVEAQCGAAHDDSDVVAVIRCGQFGGDQSAQPPQPGGCRAFPAHLAVERMRHPHFDAAAGVVEGDQATGFGFLDGGGIGDASSAASSIGSPMASASITSPTAAGRAPMRDSISSTRPGGMIGSPIHRQ